MPLDFDTNDASFLAYIQFTLDGGSTVYRWGTRYETLDDDTAIDGLLSGLSRLSRSAGEIVDPRVLFPSLTVYIDNRPEEDGTRTQDLLETYEWANAPASLIVGQGMASSSYETIFTGFVQFPGGVGWNDAAVTFTLTDARSVDGRYLPVEVYKLSDFPNMDTTFVNTGRPILIGDYRSTAEGAMAVQAIQTDDTVGTGGQFEISMYAIKELEDVLLNGTPTSYSSVDLDNARFTLDVAFDPGTDVVTVYALGATDDNTSSGTAVELAPEIFEWVLKYPLGVTAGAIDSTALADWKANLDATTDKMRRRIVKEEHSDDTLAALLNEGFADLGIEGGKYYPRYRIVSATADLPQLMEEDLAFDEDGDRIFNGEQWPEEIYCNEIVGHYQFNPNTLVYDQREDQEDTEEIADKSQRVRRTMYFKFMYKADGVSFRVSRELYAFAADPEVIHLEATAQAVVLQPSEQFRLVYNKYEADDDGVGVPFLIRQIDTDAFRMMAIIIAWNVLRLGTGTWTENAVMTWLLATARQRREKGFWGDANGYPDTTVPPDEASLRYRWF